MASKGKENQQPWVKARRPDTNDLSKIRKSLECLKAMKAEGGLTEVAQHIRNGAYALDVISGARGNDTTRAAINEMLEELGLYEDTLEFYKETAESYYIDQTNKERENKNSEHTQIDEQVESVEDIIQTRLDEYMASAKEDIEQLADSLQELKEYPEETAVKDEIKEITNDLINLARVIGADYTSASELIENQLRELDVSDDMIDIYRSTSHALLRSDRAPESRPRSASAPLPSQSDTTAETPRTRGETAPPDIEASKIESLASGEFIPLSPEMAERKAMLKALHDYYYDDHGSTGREVLNKLSLVEKGLQALDTDPSFRQEFFMPHNLNPTRQPSESHLESIIKKVQHNYQEVKDYRVYEAVIEDFINGEYGTTSDEIHEGIEVAQEAITQMQDRDDDVGKKLRENLNKEGKTIKDLRTHIGKAREAEFIARKDEYNKPLEYMTEPSRDTRSMKELKKDYKKITGQKLSKHPDYVSGHTGKAKQIVDLTEIKHAKDYYQLLTREDVTKDERFNTSDVSHVRTIVGSAELDIYSSIGQLHSTTYKVSHPVLRDDAKSGAPADELDYESIEKLKQSLNKNIEVTEDFIRFLESKPNLNLGVNLDQFQSFVKDKPLSVKFGEEFDASAKNVRNLIEGLQESVEHGKFAMNKLSALESLSENQLDAICKARQFDYGQSVEESSSILKALEEVSEKLSESGQDSPLRIALEEQLGVDKARGENIEDKLSGHIKSTQSQKSNLEQKAQASLDKDQADAFKELSSTSRLAAADKKVQAVIKVLSEESISDDAELMEVTEQAQKALTQINRKPSPRNGERVYILQELKAKGYTDIESIKSDLNSFLSSQGKEKQEVLQDVDITPADTQSVKTESTSEKDKGRESQEKVVDDDIRIIRDFKRGFYGSDPDKIQSDTDRFNKLLEIVNNPDKSSIRDAVQTSLASNGIKNINDGYKLMSKAQQHKESIEHWHSTISDDKFESYKKEADAIAKVLTTNIGQIPMEERGELAKHLESALDSMRRDDSRPFFVVGNMRSMRARLLKDVMKSTKAPYSHDEKTSVMRVMNKTEKRQHLEKMQRDLKASAERHAEMQDASAEKAKDETSATTPKSLFEDEEVLREVRQRSKTERPSTGTTVRRKLEETGRKTITGFDYSAMPDPMAPTTSKEGDTPRKTTLTRQASEVDFVSLPPPNVSFMTDDDPIPTVGPAIKVNEKAFEEDTNVEAKGSWKTAEATPTVPPATKASEEQSQTSIASHREAEETSPITLEPTSATVPQATGDATRAEITDEDIDKAIDEWANKAEEAMKKQPTPEFAEVVLTPSTIEMVGPTTADVNQATVDATPAETTDEDIDKAIDEWANKAEEAMKKQSSSKRTETEQSREAAQQAATSKWEKIAPPSAKQKSGLRFGEQRRIKGVQTKANLRDFALKRASEIIDNCTVEMIENNGNVLCTVGKSQVVVTENKLLCKGDMTQEAADAMVKLVGESNESHEVQLLGSKQDRDILQKAINSYNTEHPEKPIRIAEMEKPGIETSVAKQIGERRKADVAGKEANVSPDIKPPLS